MSARNCLFALGLSLALSSAANAYEVTIETNVPMKTRDQTLKVVIYSYPIDKIGSEMIKVK